MKESDIDKGIAQKCILLSSFSSVQASYLYQSSDSEEPPSKRKDNLGKNRTMPNSKKSSACTTSPCSSEIFSPDPSTSKNTSPLMTCKVMKLAHLLLSWDNVDSQNMIETSNRPAKQSISQVDTDESTDSTICNKQQQPTAAMKEDLWNYNAWILQQHPLTQQSQEELFQEKQQQQLPLTQEQQNEQHDHMQEQQDITMREQQQPQCPATQQLQLCQEQQLQQPYLQQFSSTQEEQEDCSMLCLVMPSPQVIETAPPLNTSLSQFSSNIESKPASKANLQSTQKNNQMQPVQMHNNKQPITQQKKVNLDISKTHPSNQNLAGGNKKKHWQKKKKAGKRKACR